MRYDTRYRASGSSFYWSFPRGVKWLIISNVAIFLIEWFGALVVNEPIFGAFALVPWNVVRRFEVWQLATYMFLHGGILHILFNMLTLWMFGAPIEDTWGTNRFLKYYFICGIGAGVCVVGANFAWGDPMLPTVGSSGAIYGLLLAYGMLFPNQTVLMSFLFPIKAKYMVMIYGAIAFLLSFRPQSPVSSFAHLGGMLFGFLYIKSQFAARSRPARRSGAAVGFDLRRRWREYRLQRAKKKFQIYMKKHGSGGGPWTQ